MQERRQKMLPVLVVIMLKQMTMTTSVLLRMMMLVTSVPMTVTTPVLVTEILPMMAMLWMQLNQKLDILMRSVMKMSAC
jgi:hypothetical protein